MIGSNLRPANYDGFVADSLRTPRGALPTGRISSPIPPTPPIRATPLTTPAMALLALLICAVPLHAQYESSADFSSYAMGLRQQALKKVQPQVVIPTQPRPSGVMGSSAAMLNGGRYPWKRNIMSTVFWVGESAAPPYNPVANFKSSWDPNWVANFGGLDTPDRAKRRGFIPASFIPRQNPFYVALPYNDVTKGRHKPEAAKVIPWFRRAFVKDGKSVCKSRWVAIRVGSRVAYAQWEDCGPFRTDHWQYVFGPARPLPNLNQGAGIDVSPAVRDYLGLSGKGVVDWKFVELYEVPPGPWRTYGDNNHFVRARSTRQSGSVYVENSPAQRSTN